MSCHGRSKCERATGAVKGGTVTLSVAHDFTEFIRPQVSLGKLGAASSCCFAPCRYRDRWRSVATYDPCCRRDSSRVVNRQRCIPHVCRQRPRTLVQHLCLSDLLLGRTITGALADARREDWSRGNHHRERRATVGPSPSTVTRTPARSGKALASPSPLTRISIDMPERYSLMRRAAGITR